MIELSIVVPLHDEAAVVPELGRRLAAAAQATGLAHELVLVDDASRDETAARVRELPATHGARLVSLASNRGQFGATQAGLDAARGRWVVVLDGDLQDPPELIPELVEARRRAVDATAVFAVKRHREDPAWFLAGRAAFGAAQRLLRAQLPAGAGSYCLLDAEIARRCARAALRTANLSAVAAAVGARGPAVAYDKAARYDGRSRVGFLGLAAEAAVSLLLSSPPGRLWMARATRTSRP